MNFNKACLHLQLNYPFTKNELKKQYRIMALKYHPDKQRFNNNNNNNSNSDIQLNSNEIYYNNKFNDIKESYDFLHSFLDDTENDTIDTDNKNDVNDSNNTYNDNCDINDYNSLFSGFISSFFSNNQIDIQNIIKTIINDCQNLSIKMFENMEKEKAIELFEFINKYYHILCIPIETVNKIKDIINEKMENDNMVIINPCLDDLINDNIYMFQLEGEKYYVPLWHDEVYYKHKGNNLVIKCLPDLPENITLDNNNNVVITIYESIKIILNIEFIHYQLGDKLLKIPVCELKIKTVQKYIIKTQGISIIQHNNIYDNSKKSNVIFIIHLS